MSVFNFDMGEPIYVERDADGLTLRFDGDTLGFNITSDGFSVTNDWNSRHFTLSLDENSILYHLTREDIDNRESGKGDLAPSDFVAEMYGYIRSIATPVPEDELNLDIVGKIDFEEVEGYLHEEGVIRKTDAGLQVDPEGKEEIEERLNENRAALGRLYQRVLEPVSVEEATSEDSGENIYAYPRADKILILFVYPDGYIGVTSVRQVLNFKAIAEGSQVMDHVIRSVRDG